MKAMESLWELLDKLGKEQNIQQEKLINIKEDAHQNPKDEFWEDKSELSKCN
jgi:hypothetical protein